MQKILFICFLFLLLTLNSLATEISVSATTLATWRYGGTTAKLRIFSNTEFTTSDGKTVVSSSPADAVWYKEIDCPVSGSSLSIPTFTLDSITDSNVSTATYTAYFFDSQNRRREIFIKDFRVPATLGNDLTWEQIVSYSQNPTPNVQPTPPVGETVRGDDTRLVRNLAGFNNSLSAAVTSLGTSETVLTITTPVTITSSVKVPKNIKLDVQGTGLLSVAANQVLSIASMNNVGNRKIFETAAANSKVLFEKNAVEYYNLAWWAGTTGGVDVTSAMNQMVESTVANIGGTIYIPRGEWLTSGGHQIGDSTFIRGAGNFPQGGYASSLKLVSPKTNYMFKIGEGEYANRFENITLDGSGLKNTSGVLLEGNYPGTSVDLSFVQTTFANFGDGVNLHSLSNSWQYAQIKFDQCYFQNNLNSAIKSNTINSSIALESTNFVVPGNAWAFDFLGGGVMNIKNSEFIGANKTSGVMHITGQHVQYNFIGCQDEGFGIFILNDASDISSVTNIIGCLVQSAIILNHSCVINSFGSTYASKTFRDGPYSSSVVTSRGDYIRAEDTNGKPVSPPVLAEFTGGSILIVEENGINKETRYRLPARFLSPAQLDGSNSPTVGIGYYTGLEQDKVALRLGRTDINGNFDYYYDFSRKYSNGRLQIQGNQMGYVGLDFNGDIRATAFSMSSVAALPSGPTIGFDANVGNVFTLIPAHNATLNVSNVQAGKPLWLIIQTAGTTSYRLTFGTGFVSAGPLNTGTVPGKYFVVKFISPDNQRFIEESRSGPL